MGRFRKIDTRIWNDEKFRLLSDDGKLVFLFCLTHPHLTALGAMRGTVEGMAAELGWLPERLSEAFTEATSGGLLESDPNASYVGSKNFLRYNTPESPNVVKSWSAALDLIPECKLKVQLISRVKAFAEGLGEAFAEALPEAFRKAMPNQEQEQEQEIMHVRKRKTASENGRNYTPDFIRFWKTFPPRGRGKKPDAWKAWLAAIDRAPAEMILAAAAEYARSPKGRGDFAGMASTWLNNDRWEDDPSAWQDGQKTLPPMAERVPTEEDLSHWSPL